MIRHLPDHWQLFTNLIKEGLPTTRELAARSMTPCSPSWLFASSICDTLFPIHWRSGVSNSGLLRTRYAAQTII